MSREIPESDWKVLRELHKVALERFCRRVLAEIDRVSSDTARTFHDRYSKIYRLIKRRDRELALAFDDPSRSRAIQQLAAMHSLKLIEPEELLRFTFASREKVTFLSSLN
jgi:hypothetical protein